MLTVLRGTSVVLLLVVPTLVRAAEFESADGPKLSRIDFDRHVQPLLNRASCNAGACHGARNGQDGFRLSLFSGSPTADYQAVIARINTKDPDSSLLLRKGTAELKHAGGARIVRDSWEYRLIRQWIAEGASRQRSGEVVSLEVTPSEHLFVDKDSLIRLSVRARFADGSADDVTHFADLRTPEQAVEIQAGGRIRATRPGYAPVLAYYHTHVVAARILVPWPAPTGTTLQQPVASNLIDREAFATLRQLHLPMAPLASDAIFLRRVCIDVAGRLPSPDEIRLFLADPDSQKRRRKIDELLADPMHAALWARRLMELFPIGESEPRAASVEKSRQRVFAWFRTHLTQNLPIDLILKDAIVANDSLVYWQTRNVDRPAAMERMAEKAATAFLGIDLSCARCHHHPLVSWSPADRLAFANVFGQLRPGEDPSKVAFTARPDFQFDTRSTSPDLPDDVRGLPFDAPLARGDTILPAKFLGGPTVNFESDARDELLRWLTTGDQPILARVFVNRVWRTYFGRGLVDPEVMVPSNPSAMPALFDVLTKDFVESGYDLRRLERMILTSHTYQLDSAIVPGYESENWFTSRHRPTRIDPTVQLDLLADGTGGYEGFTTSPPPGQRWIESAVLPQGVVMLQPAMSLVPSPIEINSLYGRTDLIHRCDDQGWAAYSALSLRGGSGTLPLIQASPRLKQLLAAKLSREQILDQLFLAFLSRPAEPNERKTVMDHFAKTISESKQPEKEIWEDVVWLLINTREMSFRK